MLPPVIVVNEWLLQPHKKVWGIVDSGYPTKHLWPGVSVHQASPNIPILWSKVVQHDGRSCPPGMYRHHISFLGHWLSLVVLTLVFHPIEVYRVETVANHIRSCNVPYPSSIFSQAYNQGISVVLVTPLLREPDPPSHWLHSELSAKNLIQRYSKCHVKEIWVIK